MTTLASWQKPVRCKKCKDEIYSRWDGEFVRCKCGAIAVDQTPYYARWIGDKDNFEEITIGTKEI